MNKKELFEQFSETISKNEIVYSIEILKNLISIIDSEILFHLENLESEYKLLKMEEISGLTSHQQFLINRNRIISEMINISNILIQEDSLGVESENVLDSYKVLFVPATYANLNFLRLDLEFRTILGKLDMSSFPDRVQISKYLCSRLSDLVNGIIKYSPQIVHFSGHGDRKGIYYADFDDIRSDSNNDLEQVFYSFSKNIRCVILNSCYSESQAEIISKHVPYVIGIKGVISDNEAINFIAHFYSFLADANSIEDAFELACNTLSYESREVQPILKKQSLS